MSTITMAGLSMWQPWGSLWLTERKINETRHWRTKFTGWLVVQAAKRPIRRGEHVGDELDQLCCAEFGSLWKKNLPFGAIIGAVEITGCHSMASIRPASSSDEICGNWSDERFAWRRNRAVKLETPIPYRGKQGFLNIPIDVIEPLLAIIPEG